MLCKGNSIISEIVILRTLRLIKIHDKANESLSRSRHVFSGETRKKVFGVLLQKKN